MFLVDGLVPAHHNSSSSSHAAPSRSRSTRLTWHLWRARFTAGSETKKRQWRTSRSFESGSARPVSTRYPYSSTYFGVWSCNGLVSRRCGGVARAFVAERARARSSANSAARARARSASSAASGSACAGDRPSRDPGYRRRLRFFAAAERTSSSYAKTTVSSADVRSAGRRAARGGPQRPAAAATTARARGAWRRARKCVVSVGPRKISKSHEVCWTSEP